MKTLTLAACLFLFVWPAVGAENTAGQAVPSPDPSAGEEEKSFRDPFASENEHTNVPPKIKDPLQPMNRAFFHFNDKLYLWIVAPAGKGYSKVVPGPARRCVSRFFANVK
jgi:phospholipid-binding lipoprotein MlaA